MSRLKSLPPLIGALPPQFARMPGPETEAERGRRREIELPWRKWYNTAEWQQLRRRVWARDAYICQRTGELLTGRYPAPNSPVANHKVPHRGDPTLFWDIDNLETVAKAVHDRQIQREERTSR